MNNFRISLAVAALAVASFAGQAQAQVVITKIAEGNDFTVPGDSTTAPVGPFELGDFQTGWSDANAGKIINDSANGGVLQIAPDDMGMIAGPVSLVNTTPTGWLHDANATYTAEFDMRGAFNWTAADVITIDVLAGGTVVASDDYTLSGGNNFQVDNLSLMLTATPDAATATGAISMAFTPNTRAGDGFARVDNLTLTASSATAVPEPGSLAALGLVCGAGLMRRRRR